MTNLGSSSPAERRLLRSYYQRYALEEADESSLPDLKGRTVFRETCSRCHTLPDPGAHPSREWAEIVDRMQGHKRGIEGVSPISDEERNTIVRYLQRASNRDTAAR